MRRVCVPVVITSLPRFDWDAILEDVAEDAHLFVFAMITSSIKSIKKKSLRLFGLLHMVSLLLVDAVKLQRSSRPCGRSSEDFSSIAMQRVPFFKRVFEPTAFRCLAQWMSNIKLGALRQAGERRNKECIGHPLSGSMRPTAVFDAPPFRDANDHVYDLSGRSAMRYRHCLLSKQIKASDGRSLHAMTPPSFAPE